MTPRLLSERRGAVLLLRISNPAARNALHPDIYSAGLAAIAAADDDPQIGAIVIAGEGATFCAGGNVQRLRESRERGDRDAQRRSIDALHAWVAALHRCGKPVIAAVEGAAAGAGCSLAFACDLLVAADDARFVMAYVRIGLTPDGGGTLALLERLPYPLAYELIATGEPIGAQRLHTLGVVNRLVPRERALDEALQWADQLAAGPRRTLSRAKALLRSADAERWQRQLQAERESFVESLFDADAGEGISAFLDKRAAQFDRS